MFIGRFFHAGRFGSSTDLEPRRFHLLLQLYSPWMNFLSKSESFMRAISIWRLRLTPAQFNSTKSIKTLNLQPAFIWTARLWVHLIFRQAGPIQSITQISSADYIQSLDQISNNIYTIHRHLAKLSWNPHPAIFGLRIAGTWTVLLLFTIFSIIIVRDNFRSLSVIFYYFLHTL